jgi:hypothetical protein
MESIKATAIKVKKGDKVFVRVEFEKAFYVFRIVFDKNLKV